MGKTQRGLLYFNAVMLATGLLLAVLSGKRGPVTLFGMAAACFGLVVIVTALVKERRSKG